MADDNSREKRGGPREGGDIEPLYLDFTRFLYEETDLEKAREVANKLQRELDSRPDLADSIRGHEIHSLLAELEGNLPEAIRWRESEIRKILELHSIAWGKPAWRYVLRQYDHSDVSDRLDLLAGLYAELGEFERALATLAESKDYCNSHDIAFDGQDLVDEFAQKMRLTRSAQLSPLPVKELDEALRQAYAEMGVSSDQLLSYDDKWGRFASSVRRRLPPEAAITQGDIKKRLVSLRKRGEKRGGLPRIRRLKMS